MRKSILVLLLALFCLSPVNSYSQDCSPTLCGDVDGNNNLDIADVTEIIAYVLGLSPIVDSACANVDGRFGITVSDIVHILDGITWFFHYFPDCNWGEVYNYLPTPQDTIFVPTMTVIPETVNRVELPIFISYFTLRSAESVYLPFLPLGPGSNSTFASDDPEGTDRIFYDIKPDTALNFDLRLNHPNSPVGRVLSGVIRYSRVSDGVGQIVPEVVNEFDLKRMALAKSDSTDNYRGDLYIPTVKYYDADPCCLGGGGNIDCDPDDKVDIADLTMLIDHLFIEFPPLCCRSEANVDVDTDVRIDIADLTMLIDHLFIDLPELQSCQSPYLDD